MQKIDVDTTVELIRNAANLSAAFPGQDAAELACNRDGIEAVVEFARWNLTQRDKLEAGDLVAATGMLLGQMLVGTLGAYHVDDKVAAVKAIIDGIVGTASVHLSGQAPEGSTYVQVASRDVGDA